MRKSNWMPSIIPHGADQNVYMVVDDFGRNGPAYRETDFEQTDLEAVITDLLAGEFSNPARVIGCNTAAGWSQDVSAEVAMGIRRCCDIQLNDVPSGLQDFCDRSDQYRDVQLPLPIRLV